MKRNWPLSWLLIGSACMTLSACGPQAPDALQQGACTAERGCLAQALSSRPQPTGTASTKRSERRKPRLAASAVDSVVLGPGVKLAAVARSSRALSSVLFMGGWLASS